MSTSFLTGSYIARDSLIHRMNPSVKLAIFISLLILILAINNIYFTLTLLIILAILCIIARISPLKLLNSVKFPLSFLLIICAINLFVIKSGETVLDFLFVKITMDGISTFVKFASKMTTLALYGALLLATTSALQIGEGAARIASPLKRFGVQVDTLSFIFVLTLRFIPSMSRDVYDIKCAQESRGASEDARKLKQRMNNLSVMLISIFASSLRHAESLGMALEARGM